MSDSSPMTLRLLTPAGTSAEVLCDSIQLVQRDGKDGQGGGSIGFLRDHAPAILALGKGEVRASLAHKTVFLAEASDGFASVRDNVVTVITDSAVILQAPEAKDTDEASV